MMEDRALHGHSGCVHSTRRDDDDDESHLLPRGCVGTRQCGLPPVVTCVTMGEHPTYQVLAGGGCGGSNLLGFVVWGGLSGVFLCCVRLSFSSPSLPPCPLSLP